MLISRNVSKVKPSLTMAISAQAKTMQAEGIDVLSLSAGEPDFPTPKHICDAGIAAINEGFTRYTPAPGTPELRKAVCKRFKDLNNLDYTMQQVIINCGAKHSVCLAISALINPDDEVIIPSPYWVSYPDMVLLAGGTPVIVDAKEEHDLKITPQQLQAAITDRTKLLILNSPSNPTGMVYTSDELKALAEIIVANDIHVLSDEIYEQLTYDNTEHISIASFSDEIFKRTITVNGVSKSYSMTGWRIGWTAGPEEIIKAMGTIQSQQTSNPASISQKAALAAITGPQDFIVEWVNAFSKRREYLVDRLNDMDGVSCILPKGAFYVFPDISAVYGRKFNGKTIDDSVSFCEFMLHEQHIALVPGAGFGNDSHVRVSYAVSMKELETAMDRFADGLKKIG